MRFFRRTGKSGPLAERVTDDVLGPLVHDRGEDWWTGTATCPDGRRLSFKLAGERAPHPLLLAHARDIVAAHREFARTVSAFLVAEADAHERFADEVRKLEVGEICLFWPDRPDDGMIYFTGPDESRLWRCDYVDRRPVGLGFDS